MRTKRKRRKKRGYFISILSIAVTICGVGILCMLITTKIEEKLFTKVAIPYEEIMINEEELSRKFYYQTFDEKEKRAYKEILQGIRENREEVYVHAEDAKRINQLFEYVLRDFPDIFWCDGTANSTLYEGDEVYVVIKPSYSYEGEEKEKKKQRIEEKVDEFLQSVPNDAGDYEKILAVYEYIVNHVDYDLEAADNQNIYSVFINQCSVCAGYSKATQYLLEKMGVFCTFITGKTSGNQNHAWNLVMCDGDYYYVDTTWGDPIFQEEENEEDIVNIANISYDYMCCDETQLFKTHIPDQDIILPECTKMDKNYYVVNNVYFEEYDREIILQKMNTVINAGENPSIFKFANDSLYKEAKKDIFENVIREAAQNLAQKYGLQKVQYRYIDDEKLNKITIYWSYDS
ncbi:MAG: transglutaminase domain-containing protein [Dorea sp.]